MADYGITRPQGYKLVTTWTKNPNLIKHMLAVEAQMRALAHHFGENEQLWGLAGLLHDADYELFKDEPLQHPSRILTKLEKLSADPRLLQAIRAHAWGPDRPSMPEPSSRLDWALYCCDDLSGLIIACALVKPDRKLASVTTATVLSKWKDKSFARGAHREPAELSEEKLGLPLPEFIQLCLHALQDIAEQLEL